MAVSRRQLTFLGLGGHREYDVGADWRERAKRGEVAI
jgi:hypothetical protein